MAIVVSLFVGMLVGFLFASYIDHVEQSEQCHWCRHNNRCAGNDHTEDEMTDPEIQAMING